MVAFGVRLVHLRVRHGEVLHVGQVEAESGVVVVAAGGRNVRQQLGKALAVKVEVTRALSEFEAVDDLDHVNELGPKGGSLARAAVPLTFQGGLVSGVDLAEFCRERLRHGCVVLREPRLGRRGHPGLDGLGDVLHDLGHDAGGERVRCDLTEALSTGEGIAFEHFHDRTFGVVDLFGDRVQA